MEVHSLIFSAFGCRTTVIKLITKSVGKIMRSPTFRIRKIKGVDLEKGKT